MRAFAAAALAAYEAAWAPERVHRAGEVPTPPPPGAYGVVSVSSGSAENYRSGATSAGSRSQRVVVQCVGKSVDEVGFAVEKADAAYRDKKLAVAGYRCTPCHPEVSSPVIRDPDGGAFLTCTLTYTFAATPA